MNKKTIIIIICVAVVIAGAVLLFLPGQESTGPEVASMRMKVEAPASTPAPQDNATVPSTQPLAQQQPIAEAPKEIQPSKEVSAPVPIAPQAQKQAEPKIAQKTAIQPEKPTKKNEVKVAVKPLAQAKTAVEPKKEANGAVKTAKAEAKNDKAKFVAKEPTQKTEPKKPAAKPEWGLNIASLPSYDDSIELATKLKKGGYNAYITQITIDGVKWHRVRVGFFATREDAVAASKGLKSKYGLDDAWIVRPDTAEASRHMK